MVPFKRMGRQQMGITYPQGRYLLKSWMMLLRLFIVMMSLLVTAMWWRWRKNVANCNKQLDVEQIQIEVLHCTAQDAVLLEEFEDEGLGCFLDVGDQQILSKVNTCSTWCGATNGGIEMRRFPRAS